MSGFWIVLVEAGHRQRRPVGEIPAHRGSKHIALFTGRHGLAVAFASQSDKPVTQIAVADRPGAVERQLAGIVGADAEAEQRRGVVRRPLAHHVDQSTGRRVAVEHGRRALQDLDALGDRLDVAQVDQLAVDDVDRERRFDQRRGRLTDGARDVASSYDDFIDHFVVGCRGTAVLSTPIARIAARIGPSPSFLKPLPETDEDGNDSQLLQKPCEGRDEDYR